MITEAVAIQLLSWAVVKHVVGAALLSRTWAAVAWCSTSISSSGALQRPDVFRGVQLRLALVVCEMQLGLVGAQCVQLLVACTFSATAAARTDATTAAAAAAAAVATAKTTPAFLLGACPLLL